MKWIVSGFLPFRHQNINPSQLIVESLALPTGSEKIILPVVYQQSWADFKIILEKNKNEFSRGSFRIVMLGQAAGRKQICLEKYGHNLADSSYADESGSVLVDQPILLQGDVAFASALSLRDLVTQAQRLNLPIEISYSAGAYVCNYIFYQTLNWLKENRLLANAVFVHLPLLEDLDLEKQKSSVSWILKQLEY